MNDQKRKSELDMPSQGEYALPYLYVVVVCAAGSPGYGAVLMDLVQALAAELGIMRIALSGLPNACGFYYSRGYEFCPWSGRIFDVPERYLTLQTNKVTGKTKTILEWDKDVSDPMEVDLRNAEKQKRSNDDPPPEPSKRSRRSPRRPNFFEPLPASFPLSLLSWVDYGGRAKYE